MFGFGGPKTRDSQKNTPANAYDFALALGDVRANLGPAPRAVEKQDKIAIPSWALSDNLQLIAKNQHLLSARGSVGWGALVQANNQLFQPGPSNLPGNLLYSTDPQSFGDPGVLVRAASDLFNIKGKETDPELQLFSDTLADEMERLFRIRMPAQLTGSIESWFTTVLFERSHLPNGIVGGRLMPILAHPDTEAIIVVPHHYWPPSLTRVVWGI